MVRTRSVVLAASLTMAACGTKETRLAPAVRAEPTPADSVRRWTVDDSLTTPTGVRTLETAGVGSPATWEVVEDPTAPSAPHAFGVTHTRNVGGTLNLAVFDAPPLADLEISTWLREVTGEEDRGGGLVWRLRDPQNYYVARWKRGNVRVYVVANGHRRRIASADVDVDPGGWHQLGVVMTADHIEVSFGGQPVLQVDDRTHSATGSIGLWTKADAATLFDDLMVDER